MSRFSQYSPLVWRLMVFAFIIGLTSSLPDILFNFYLLSLGFDNSVAGELASIVRLAGFAMAIPLGIAVDRFGGISTYQHCGVVCHIKCDRFGVVARDLFFLGGLFYGTKCGRIAIDNSGYHSRTTPVFVRVKLFDFYGHGCLCGINRWHVARNYCAV